jgi:hypothetical protein
MGLGLVHFGNPGPEGGLFGIGSARKISAYIRPDKILSLSRPFSLSHA